MEYQQKLASRAVRAASHLRTKVKHLISWHNRSDGRRVNKSLRHSSAEWELFSLSFKNRSRNDKQMMIFQNMSPHSASRGNFPADVLEANVAVCNVFGASGVINHSCYINCIAGSHKIFITSHGDFNDSIISTTSTTLRIVNLLFLNHSWNLSGRFEDVKVFYKGLDISFIVWGNQLCDKLVANVSAFGLKQRASQFGRKNKPKWEWIMASRKNVLIENCKLESVVVGVFGVGVSSSVFAWTFRPVNVFDSFESNLKHPVGPVGFAVDMHSAFNVSAWHVDILWSL